MTPDHSSQIVGSCTALPGGSQEHTGTRVRIAGTGPQAADLAGLTDHTGVFGTLKRALRLRRVGGVSPPVHPVVCPIPPGVPVP